MTQALRTDSQVRQGRSLGTDTSRISREEGDAVLNLVYMLVGTRLVIAFERIGGCTSGQVLAYRGVVVLVREAWEQP